MTKNKATKYRTEFIVDVVSTYANVLTALSPPPFYCGENYACSYEKSVTHVSGTPVTYVSGLYTVYTKGERGGFGLFALRFGKSQSNSKYVRLNFRELVLLEKWEITEPTGGVHFDAVAPVSDFSDDSCGNRRMTQSR